MTQASNIAELRRDRLTSTFHYCFLGASYAFHDVTSYLNSHLARRPQMRLSVVGSIIALLLALTVPALAQQGTAEIGGRITDQQQGALPGVTVTLTNEDTGVFREVTTGADGHYFAPQLVPGRYRITAKLPSFHTFERGGLILQVGKTLTIDASLTLGSMQE